MQAKKYSYPLCCHTAAGDKDTVGEVGFHRVGREGLECSLELLAYSVLLSQKVI